MKEEVSVAVNFITKLIQRSTKNSPIDKDQLELFKTHLSDLLCHHYANHWFPEQPTRGQGFRSLAFNEADLNESIIEEAALAAGLTYQQLHLPSDVTIWVDPRDVSSRLGDHQGSFFSLATFKADGQVVLEEIDLDEIQKKNREYKEKQLHDMGTRKNGRRGFLSGNGSSSSPNFKSRAYQNSVNSSHHGHGIHSPNPVAVNWYNSVNSQHQAPSSSMEMFSSSPPNQYGYNLAKFSPPKYGYGTASKWNPPPGGTLYAPTIASTKSDKYHWFNSTKPTIKA